MKRHNTFTCGLGLRDAFLAALATTSSDILHFLEIAPENWLEQGGKRIQLFEQCAERYPLICHGLSLSLGSLAPLDIHFIKQLKQFFETYDIKIYSEHLSYCSDEQGQLYDLFPLPFTEDAVKYVANRIRQVQDILQQKIALENVTYYAKLPGELSEIEFIRAVVTEADCLLLLDVNNLYVNSINHHYDPLIFLRQLPQNKISYCHIAGHTQKTPDLIFDTHGTPVIEPVWQLLETVYDYFGILPTILERDNAVPPLSELLEEITILKTRQLKYEK